MEVFDDRVTPSLLDRLTDYSPEAKRENPATRHQGVRALKSSLWRDLTALLNTKRGEEDVPKEFAESTRSLLAYGIPDFTSYTLSNPSDQNKICRALEMAIRRFEPRLENPSVTVEAAGPTDFSLRFRVDAYLKVEPASEPVSFEAVLQPDTSTIVVVGDGR